MGICTDCHLEKWTDAAGNPGDPGFCECPSLKTGVEGDGKDEDE